MDQNFHYHVTYTAAVLAGFSPEDGQKIARAAQYVDECGVTVQSTGTLIWDNLWDTFPGNQQIREVLNIWPVFHFLPGDYAVIQNDVDPPLRDSSRPALQLAAQLICTPESRLVQEMVEAVKAAYGEGPSDGGGDAKLQRVGIAMHVLADTFAHQGFAGIPLSCVNEVREVREMKLDGTFGIKRYQFLEYSPALFSRSFGYLGHGRIGYLADQPGACFAYRAAWRDPVGDSWTVRCNPLEFFCAYLQMKEAMSYILGNRPLFSNYLDRGLLLDQRWSGWAETQRFLRALEEAGTDSGLPDRWYAAVNAASHVERPQRYVPYSEAAEQELIESFQTAARAHRQMVLERCAPLQAYLELYP